MVPAAMPGRYGHSAPATGTSQLCHQRALAFPIKTNYSCGQRSLRRTVADEEHLKILRQGVDAWNAWRRSQLFKVQPDLSGADLSDADLSCSNFYSCICRGTNFERARLNGATFHEADLSAANLRGANLLACNLTETILVNIDLSEAITGDTVFGNTDLSTVKGLNRVEHVGGSIIDHRTLFRSENFPLAFLRGCGLSDDLIDYLPSLRGDAVQFYSCFISYSSKDEEFAERLHADLQDNGVRCWFAPHDLPIGEKILDGIDQAIRLRDKVVLILSEDAVASDWVEDEVSTAFEEERRRKETMLFPIRLDDAVMETCEAWASKLRARNIGDFTKWKDHDAYRATFERVMRDLRSTG